MPIIPRYEAKRRLTTKPAGPRISGVAPVGKAMTQAGAALFAIGEKFKQVKANQEYSQASVKGSQGLNQFEIEASQFTDPNDFEALYKKIPGLKAEISKTIRDPEARTKFGNAFDLNVISSSNRIRRFEQTAIANQSKFTGAERIEEAKRKWIAAEEGSLDQQVAWDEGEAVLKGFQDDLIYTADQIIAMRKAKKKDWQESKIKNGIATNPELTKEKLLAGMYEDLSADETVDFIEMADKQIEANKKSAQDDLDEIWRTNIGEVVTNLKATSVEDLTQMVANNEIDPVKGNKLIKWKTDKDRSRPWGQYETDKSIWQEMVRDSVRPGEDLKKFQDRIADAISKEQIDADEAAEFVVQIESYYETAIANKSRPSRFHQMIGATIDMLETWAEQNTGSPTSVLFNMTKELMSGVKDNKITEENIEEEGQRITDDAQKILYPGYNVEDLEFTAKETGLTIRQVFDILEKKAKE